MSIGNRMTKFTQDEMRGRLARIRSVMAATNTTTLLLTEAANIRYATGFCGEPRTLLLTAKEATLYTSYRSESWAIAQTKALVADLEISTIPTPLDDIRDRLSGSSHKLGIDHAISHRNFLTQQQFFPAHELQTSDIIEQIRRIKSPAEQQLLRESQRLNEAIFNSILPDIRPGMTERAVQGLITSAIAMNEQLDGPSFTPIVAAGANAWEIHHQPDQTIIKPNQILLIDLGVMHGGYASDMTRSVCLGTANDSIKQVHELVLHAQQTAIAMMKPAVTTREIDIIAREIITEAGHARGYTHGLGHSIGLETHDPGLVLAPKSPATKLQAGMVFTVEPGIYLENQFGIRLEDIVIIKENGTENLTQQPHDIIELAF